MLEHCHRVNPVMKGEPMKRLIVFLSAFFLMSVVAFGQNYTIFGITEDTSYIASWTTNATASMVCEDYSGVVAVNSALSRNTATGSSATDSITVTTEDANNWVVCGMGEGNQTLTASVGNSRQQVTAGADGKSLLLDNRWSLRAA